MRKKLEGNGLWESSRMMLPEHKTALNNNSAALKQHQRIELDEQEWEQISRLITESLLQRELVAIRLFHPEEELAVIGIVDRMDTQKGRFMVDGEWFQIKDIQGAEHV